MAFKNPNYTQTPNDLIDKYLSLISGAELKIMMVIFRRTVGFHMRVASISFTTFIKLTGLSRQGVINSLESLESKEWIKINVGDRVKSSTYEVIFEPPEEDEEVVNLVDQGSQLIRPQVVNSVDRLKKDKETLKENNNRAKKNVVVPSCLMELKLDKEYLRDISSKLSLEDATLLRQRVDRWKDRDNDMKACRTILKRWDTWDDKSSQEQKEDKEESHRRAAQELFGESMTIKINDKLNAIADVCRGYVEIIYAGKGVVFEYSDIAFKSKINEYLDKTQFKGRVNV